MVKPGGGLQVDVDSSVSM